MHNYQHLCGVYAAAVTPLKSDFSPDTDALPALLGFLAERGCHGVLLLGTTGEGPSMAPNERIAILRSALEVRQMYPDLRLLAGTGTPSLEETIALTRASFDLGYDGVVVLPPYYYRQVSDEGLIAWFNQVIQQSVPKGSAFLVYHIPGISRVPLSINLLTRLKETYPHRFAGLKDSSGDPEHARLLGDHFGNDLLILTGNDRLFSLALQAEASGCITALANIGSPVSRHVWDTYQQGDDTAESQRQLTAARIVLEDFSPFPPVLKVILAHKHNFPNWIVRPPLLSLTPAEAEKAVAEIDAVL